MGLRKGVAFIWEEVGVSILRASAGPLTCTFWTISLVEGSVEKQYDLSCGFLAVVTQSPGAVPCESKMGQFPAPLQAS